MVDNKLPMGPWEGEDLEGTYEKNQNSYQGEDAGLDDKVRFIRGTHDLICNRAACPDSVNDPKTLAVFIIKDKLDDQEIGCLLKRIPILDNGLTQINKRVWFVSPAVASGKFIDFTEMDDEELFNWIINDLGCGDDPAIIIDPRSQRVTLRYYDSGLNEADNVEIHQINEEQITEEMIAGTVDNLYSECLITPTAQSGPAKLWKNEIPIKYAEQSIQMSMKIALATKFLSCCVREENTGKSGRYDIYIRQKLQFQRGHIPYAILELKVLRSKHHSGTIVPDSDNLSAVEKGVRQARAYRAEWDTTIATLYCFDMREKDSGDDCFGHVRSMADRNQIVLRKWYLYSSAEKYRQAHHGA